MEKQEENYSANLPVNFTALDYSLDQQQHQYQQQQEQFIRPRIGENSGENNVEMVDYMFNNPTQQAPSSFCTSTSLDRLNLGEVMQFADFGPKLALNQVKFSEEENGIDPVYFLKFPVLNDKLQDQNLMAPPPQSSMGNDHENKFDGEGEEDEFAPLSDNNSVQQLRFLGGNGQKNTNGETKNRRKRPRSMKTSEEVESQRMTHIAVERNRRKQMNEHLRVLRSLMPGSYVQRGNQASIIGGAIEFVRELEQLLQCLESQKRRRIFGGANDSASLTVQQPQPPCFPPMPLPGDQMKIGEFETGILEETAENKSCLADVEVKVLGFDAIIKILSRQRPGQLLETIAALEDLQLNILHTNITTIEQTVFHSMSRWKTKQDLQQTGSLVQFNKYSVSSMQAVQCEEESGTLVKVSSQEYQFD